MVYLFYRVQREDIYPIKYLLEGFENLMTVSTVDEAHCKIQISLTPDFLEECEQILADLGNRFSMIRLSDDPTRSQANY